MQGSFIGEGSRRFAIVLAFSRRVLIRLFYRETRFKTLILPKIGQGPNACLLLPAVKDKDNVRLPSHPRRRFSSYRNRSRYALPRTRSSLATNWWFSGLCLR